MQWKQIKTLFILCFLVLDIYLLFMFVNNQNDAEFALPDTSDATFKQQLESENITVSAELPSGDFSEPYLSLKQKSFSNKELAFFENADNQKTEVVDGKMILSRFKDPIAVPEDADGKMINEIMKGNIPLFDDYTFGNWNKDMNILIFFQQKKGFPIYYNQSGSVLVFLNDNNDMVFYTQTMLGKGEPTSKEKTLIDPNTAIKAIFDKNRLESGDEITDVNMGLYTRIPPETSKMIFSPVWTLTVNQEDNFQVNAIENLIVSRNEQSFLTGAVTSTIEKVQKLDDDNDVKNSVLPRLKTLLPSNQQSGGDLQ